MMANPAVERWFAETKHPKEGALRRIREIPGRYPNLEGDGPNARFMRFADADEVEARAGELRRIAIAFCDMKDSG